MFQLNEKIHLAVFDIVLEPKKSIVANIWRKELHKKKFSAFSLTFHGPDDSINCCQHSCQHFLFFKCKIGVSH